MRDKDRTMRKLSSSVTGFLTNQPRRLAVAHGGNPFQVVIDVLIGIDLKTAIADGDAPGRPSAIADIEGSPDHIGTGGADVIEIRQRRTVVRKRAANPS